MRWRAKWLMVNGFGYVGGLQNAVGHADAVADISGKMKPVVLLLQLLYESTSGIVLFAVLRYGGGMSEYFYQTGPVFRGQSK